jgi:IclR family transcriptional regulator, KDG regulon repressor
MPKNNSASLRTVLGALEVMEYLGSYEGEPVRLTDISRDLHFPKTRVYRILSTLERRKYVWQDPDSHGYSLSLRTWLLGRHTNVYRFLHSVVEPYVDDLAAQSQETSIFAILDGVKAVHLYVSQTLNPVLAYVSEGSRVPLHASATGKAILSKLGPEFVTQMLPPELERFTPNTIVDRNELIKEIEKIRQVEYATGVDEISEGVSGVAAASVIGKQMIYWAIGISGPTSRISYDRLQELGRLAVRAVGEIDKKLNNEVG